MAKTIGEAILLLQKIGQFDITGMQIDSNIPTEHFVNHKYKDEIIIPFIGVTNNTTFILSKGDHYITTADGIRCKVAWWEEKNILDLEEDIERLYHMQPWDFLKRWKKTYKFMENMCFLHLKLKKEE